MEPTAGIETSHQSMLGLRKVVPAEGDIDTTTVDIIAIHGLDTESPQTWIYKKDGGRVVNWLEDRDMLPASIPNARIYTYNWNARAFNDAPVQTLLGYADNLLALVEGEQVPNPRPIVFIASCFGGLILAEAINRAAVQNSPYQRVLHNTAGMIFLATPFRGSDAAEPAKWYVVVHGIMGKQTSKQLVDDLNKEDKELRRLTQSFAEIVHSSFVKLPVHCFYETKKTKMLRKFLPRTANIFSSIFKNKTELLLVSEQSACLDGLERHALHGVHSQMNKFDGPESANYKIVMPVIKKLVDEAPTVVYRRNHGIDTNAIHSTRNAQQEKERMDILTWLSPLPYLDHHETAKLNRSPDTGDWIIERPEYLKLKECEDQHILWIHGIMGAGKTKLTSRIIDEILKQRSDGAIKTCRQKRKIQLAFFYCVRSQHERTQHIHIISSFIRQLVEPLRTLPSKVSKVYREKSPQSAASKKLYPSDCLDMLKNAIDHHEEVWLILDGLDECDDGSIQELLELFTKISKRPGSRVKIVISSRDLPMIDGTSREALSLNIDISAEGYNKSDITRFIKNRLENSKLRYDLLYQIEATAASRSGTSFQYAVAYLDYVLGLPTSCILSKLKDTPKDITELYNEIFDDIKFKPNWGPIVMRSFKWLQVHDGSSSSKLLLAAISQNSIGDSMGKYLEDIDKLLDACRFLLIRDDKFIRFSHESIRIFVQEYFMAEIEYRDFAATVILNTLLFYKPSAEPTLEIDELYQEALYNWRWYVYPLRNEKNVRYLLGKFFEKEPSPGYQDWLLYLADEILNLDFSDEEKANFVFSPREWLRPQESRIEYYYSIQSRLEGDSTRRLLMAFTAYYASKAKSTLATSSNFDEWEVLHLPDGYFSGSPTHNPQKSVVPTSKDLDDYENRNDGHGYVNHGKELQEMQLSYLHFSKWIASEFKSASFERESRFVRILQYSSTQPPEFQKQLARYFLLCVCSMPSDSDSCAQLADSTLINLNTYECQEYKYQHILEVCFNLSETLITPHFWDNSLDGYSMNVLYQPRIIEFLIDNGANVNFELGRHSTFSIYDFREDWTSFSDRMSSFILWERYGTPLIAAAAAYDAKNVDEIMSLLLDCGANINQVAEDGQYGTALIAACARPIKSAVERLLSLDGIDVNTRARKDGYSRYGTALIAACDNDKDHKDQYEIIEMLLEKGADVNITALTGSYGTALIAACSLDTASDGWGDNDQAGIINRLFKKGADTNITALAGYYGTALIAACAGCESGIVKIILERGAKVNTIVSIGHYGTALITACYFCDTNVVRMLLERDAEVNAEVLTGNYGTALIAACSAGANEIIHLLLAADANLNATVSVGDYGTAFSATCAKGKIRDVKQLLEKGAQPNISTEGVKYTSAFSAALAHKNIGIAITLLDQCEGIDSSSLPMIEDEVERMELFRGDYISTPDQIASLKDKEWKGQCQWATGRLSFALLCFSANQDLEWLKEDRQKAINYMSCFCHEENNLEAAYDMVYSLGVYVRKDAGVLENWRRVLREGPETVTSQGWDHFAGLLLGLFRDLCQSVYLGELEGR